MILGKLPSNRLSLAMLCEHRVTHAAARRGAPNMAEAAIEHDDGHARSLTPHSRFAIRQNRGAREERSDT